jgi:hypothetical protein
LEDDKTKAKELFEKGSIPRRNIVYMI